MAIGSSAPPRAYTREILTTAFNWLQSQPDSTRTKATTPDALVALYMQAQRGGAALQGFDAEAPQSSQAFMSDLKNLAEGLKEFDDSRQVRSVPPPASARAPAARPAATSPSYAQSAQPAAMTYARAQKSFPLDDTDLEPTVAPRAASFAQPPQAPASEQPAPSYQAAAPVFESREALNERSLQMIADVQLAMNLTSEAEAINLMIAVAHKNLKSLLA